MGFSDSLAQGETRELTLLVIEPIAEKQPEPVTILMNWPAVLDR